MPWQAAALTPLQLSFAGARWLHLSVLLCFLLHLYATKRHLLLSPIKKRCVWQQAQPLGQPHIYLGNCYYLALGSGFLLKPQFPITRGHCCACRDVVLERPGIWQSRSMIYGKTRRLQNKQYCEKWDLWSLGDKALHYFQGGGQHSACCFRYQEPGSSPCCALVPPALHLLLIQKRNGENSRAETEKWSDRDNGDIPHQWLPAKGFDRSWSCARVATWRAVQIHSESDHAFYIKNL